MGARAWRKAKGPVVAALVIGGLLALSMSYQNPETAEQGYRWDDGEGCEYTSDQAACRRYFKGR